MSERCGSGGDGELDGFPDDGLVFELIVSMASCSSLDLAALKY